MSKLDVWTVSIMFCTEHGKTRADAFLQGPEVEVECSGWADPDARTPASVVGTPACCKKRTLRAIPPTICGAALGFAIGGCLNLAFGVPRPRDV